MIKVNSISTHFLCVCVHLWGIHLPVNMFPETRRGGELSNSYPSFLGRLQSQAVFLSWLPPNTVLRIANATPFHCLSECCGLKVRLSGLFTKQSVRLPSLHRPLQALKNAMFAHCSSFPPLCCPRWHFEHLFHF